MNGKSEHRYTVVTGRIPLGASTYDRWGVIVAIVGPDYTVFPICTEPSEREQINSFEINELDEGFHPTGLKHTSYVLDKATVFRDIQVLEVAGELTGKIKERFKRWLGLTE